MNKILLSLLFSFCSILMFSQDNDSMKSEIVSFVLIENPPVFPGCETLDKNLQKKCLQNKIQKHVGRKFNTSLANSLDLKPGKTRVHVTFEISSDGIIKNIKARGEHNDLEVEAIRVIKSLPKMTPGSHEGIPVGVKYTLPITLLVEDTKITEEKVIETVEDENEDISVPFSVIEDVPIFPGCEKLDKNLQKMCLQNQIKKHVANNFNIKLANEVGLSPGKKRIFVRFTIDKNGDVVDIIARGPHSRLENEGKRVVKMLPKMTPGKQEGKPVKVKYTLPITVIVDKKSKSDE